MATELTPTERLIRDFLLQEILYHRQLADLGPKDMLLKDKLLDSIGVLQIVTFCEGAFDISIPETELRPDHFETIRTIAQLVERHLSQKRVTQ